MGQDSWQLTYAAACCHGGSIAAGSNLKQCSSALQLVAVALAARMPEQRCERAAAENAVPAQQTVNVASTAGLSALYSAPVHHGVPWAVAHSGSLN